MEKEKIEKAGIKGIVRIRVFDKDGREKKLFQGNRAWDFLKKVFNLDVKIKGITGDYTTEGLMYNTITNAGLALTAKRLGGITADPITHIAIGTGTPTATALGAEITTAGGARAGVTPASATTTVANDTIRITNTFTFTSGADFAITEEGLFNASTGGTLVASRSFSAIGVVSGDSLQITHDIVMSTI
jgi:hypothetical protein